MARTSGPEPTALVLAPASAVLAAGPATRQALAVAADAPWPALRAAAERGPVPVASSPVPRKAHAAADALRREHGLQLEVVESAGLAWAGGAVAAFVVAAATLALGLGLALLLSSWIAALLGVLVAGALVAVGATSSTRARVGASQWDAGLAALADLDARRAQAPEAWAALTALRKASLAPELPPTAQADLWSALDDLDERVLASPGDPAVIAEIEAAEATLAGREVEPVGQAARALRAVRAADAETTFRPRPSERERS